MDNPAIVAKSTLAGVKHVILILSGKGGVGKSSVSVQLALSLKEKGFKVGLLDIDLCGPSIPHLLKLEGKDVFQSSDGWIPVYTDESQRLAVMSIGFLLKNEKDSVIWRGPKKTAMIRQFLSDVCWQDIDYLLIDTPPGTSDEHITVMENMKIVDNCDGAIIVTTPQQVSIEDVRKEITFCRKTGIKIVGIIENMSGYVCPHCTDCFNVFSSGGGEALAKTSSIPFLGSVPLDPAGFERTYQMQESAISIMPDSELGKSYERILNELLYAKYG